MFSDNSRVSGCCRRGSGNSQLRKIQEIDFAIVETVLYLNAHPDSKAALAFYNKLVDERKKLNDSLSKAGYPITHRDNCNADSWQWTNGPWPWQIDAN